MKKIKRIFYVLLGVSLLTDCGAPFMQEIETLNVKAVSNVQAAGQISDADKGTLFE